jgi:DNA repair protein RadC
MAISKSTTFTRRNRNSFEQQVLEKAMGPSLVPQLFVQRGEAFERVSDTLLLQCARQLVAEHFRPGAPVLNTPERIRDFLRFEVGMRDHEVFALILLDRQHRLRCYVELAHGTVDGCRVIPQHVLECVIKHHASAVILVHNHPSGNAQPSMADMLVTERLQKALALIDVEVVDHFIVGDVITSMAQLGKLR